MLERILNDLQEFIEMLESDMDTLRTTEAKRMNKNIISDLKDLQEKYEACFLKERG